MTRYIQHVAVMLVSFAVYVAASDDIFLTKQPSAAPKPQGNLTVRLKPHEDWTREICLGIFLAAYAINIYLGRRLNQHLALWWTTQVGFCFSRDCLGQSLAQTTDPVRFTRMHHAVV